MNRRDFLITKGASAFFPCIATASTLVALVAQPINAQILPEGEPENPMIGCNGGKSGPALRARQVETFEVGADGNLNAFRGTKLVDAYQIRDIVCEFDKPVKSLLHCYMLGHKPVGMKAWVEIT